MKLLPNFKEFYGEEGKCVITLIIHIIIYIHLCAITQSRFTHGLIVVFSLDYSLFALILVRKYWLIKLCSVLNYHFGKQKKTFNLWNNTGGKAIVHVFLRQANKSETISMCRLCNDFKSWLRFTNHVKCLPSIE